MVKLQVNDLFFSYGNGFQALADVKMDAQESDLVCLIGPNGSGKSTLIKCILKIFTPQKGKIIFDGTDLRKIALADLAKIVGYVPQSSQYVFPVTVFEAILTGRLPYLGWVPKASDLKKVEDTMNLFKIEEWAWRYLNTLSGGERQKVLLAMTLSKEPKVLLLDEPTSNLDLRHQLEVMDLLRRLVNDQKLTVIMATHDLNLALKYADRVVMMKKSKVIAEGTPLSAFTKENIKRVFDVEVEIVVKTGAPFIRPICPS